MKFGFKKYKPLDSGLRFAWLPVYVRDLSLKGKADVWGTVWLEYYWVEPWDDNSGYKKFAVDKDGIPKDEAYETYINNNKDHA